MFLVAGTQADRPNLNKILVMKLSELHRTKYDGENEGKKKTKGKTSTLQTEKFRP
jgi:hypothetical protein